MDMLDGKTGEKRPWNEDAVTVGMRRDDQWIFEIRFKDMIYRITGYNPGDKESFLKHISTAWDVAHERS